jgi:hypothetical protein
MCRGLRFEDESFRKYIYSSACCWYKINFCLKVQQLRIFKNLHLIKIIISRVPSNCARKSVLSCVEFYGKKSRHQFYIYGFLLLLFVFLSKLLDKKFVGHMDKMASFPPSSASSTTSSSASSSSSSESDSDNDEAEFRQQGHGANAPPLTVQVRF